MVVDPSPEVSEKQGKDVVTVSGVTWTSFTSSYTFGCGGWEGVGSLSTGSPSGGGSGTSTSAKCTVRPQ